MNIIALSFDTNLLKEGVTAGSALKCFRTCASVLDGRAPGSQLRVVVRTPSKQQANVKRWSDSLSVHPTHAPLGAYMLQMYRQAGRLIREHGAALVITQTPFTDGVVGYLLKRRYGVKFIPQLHKGILDDPFWVAEHPANFWRRAVGKFVLRHSDVVRVVSERARQWVIAQTGLPEDRVLNNPDSTAIVGMPAPEPSARLNQVLFVGRLTFQKGVDVLLRAFALALRDGSNYQLVIVGDGEERTRLQRIAEQLGISERVVWRGLVTHQELVGILASAYAFVLPSRYEAFGKVIVEAMNFAVPVISTDTDGGLEIITDGVHGFIVPKENEHAIAEKLVFLFKHPEEAARIGAIAQRRVRQKYEPHTLCSAWVDFWFKVVGSQQS